MRKFLAIGALLFAALQLASCQTSDGALRDQGNSEAYILGFHDGRHSGMSEQGNTWEHYIRDRERFDSDQQYRGGWLAGEVEGSRLQAQAAAVGEAVGDGYTGYRVGQEAEKAGPHPKAALKDAMQGVDTESIRALEN